MSIPTARRVVVHAVTLVAACLLPLATAVIAGAQPDWVPPVGGPLRVARGFDPPARPWLPGHRGVDLVASDGDVVRAAGSGVVTYAGLLAGRGVVAVGHGDLRTTYEPVAVSVAVGEQVTAGQPIGTLSAAGSHCRPATCLHWGLVRGETYLDPLRLFGGGPVRLLPLGAKAVGAAPTGGRPTSPDPLADRPSPGAQVERRSPSTASVAAVFDVARVLGVAAAAGVT
jgi:murein DD-endopeptidase MepM/ murein hydrolase activator NlpD